MQIIKGFDFIPKKDNFIVENEQFSLILLNVFLFEFTLNDIELDSIPVL